MLKTLLKWKDKKHSLTEAVERVQQGDCALQNELIQQYKPFIAKTAATVCQKFIRESDDEFSIGMIAFNEAMLNYAPEKGASLLSFAELIIKRRIIDYLRKESRAPMAMEENEQWHISEALDYFTLQQTSEDRIEEIARYSSELLKYGLTFQELTTLAPKQRPARQQAIEIAHLLMKEEKWRELIVAKKQLPLTELEKVAHVSRKTLERHRKYIIAVFIILNGDYNALKPFVRGEWNE